MKQKTNVLMEIEEEIENREFPFDFSELDNEYCDSCKCFLPWYAGTSYDTHYLGRIDLCKLCKPWVKNSLYDIPSHFKGFTIYDVPLFIDTLDRIIDEGSSVLYSPVCDDIVWAKLFDRVLPESKNIIKYKTRRIFDHEHAHHSEYCTILSLIQEYRFKVSEVDNNYRTFRDSGVSHLQKFDYELPEALVIGNNEIIINPIFMHSSSPIAVINGVKIDNSDAAKAFFHQPSHSNHLAQLVFEEINNFSSIELPARVKQTMLDIQFLKDHECTNFILNRTYLTNQLASILSGEKGKLSKYTLLAIIFIVEIDIHTDRDTHLFIWRDREVWARSIQFLESIIDSLGSRAIIKENYIVVEGTSGTNYIIVPHFHTSNPTFWKIYAFDPKELVHLGPKEPEYWESWDEYFEMVYQYEERWQQRHICIDMLVQNKKLPIGDHLAALVLALSNDLISKNKICTLNSYFSSNKLTEENRGVQ